MLHKIEEIYDERHVMEIQELEIEIQTNKPSKMEEKKTMPTFVYDYFVKKHKSDAKSADQVRNAIFFNILILNRLLGISCLIWKQCRHCRSLKNIKKISSQ